MPILGRSAGSHLGLGLGLGVGRLLGFIEGYIYIHFGILTVKNIWKLKNDGESKGYI